MSQRIRIRVLHNARPEVRLYVTALIELARQHIAAEEAAAAAGGSGETPPLQTPPARPGEEPDHA